MLELNEDYKIWLNELKSRVRSVQLKAAMTVNSQLLEFYWELGKTISEKQTIWGSHFLENLSKDLQSEFPEMKGFSVTNLKYCKLFFNYFSKSPQLGDEMENQFSPQLGDEFISQKNHKINHSVFQIPWGHINKPMGVSEFQITENLPENIKSSLPTIEEIELELSNFNTSD